MVTSAGVAQRLRAGRIAFGMTLVGLLLGILPGSPARATAPTVCTYEFDTVLSPGISMTPTKGTWDTGETGTITCKGTVRGQHPTGAGRFKATATYGSSSPGGDSCLGGAGMATYSFTLPTSEGSVTVEDTLNYTFGTVPGALGVPGTGRWNGTVSSGSVVFLPTEGTCVLTPMTKAHVSGSGNFPS